MKYILEYKDYDKGGRGSSIDKEVFLKLLKQNCTEWLKDPKPLIRFKNSESDDYELVKPKSHIRSSLNRDNYNTMLMDNLPSWSKFPKRSKSIIFFNDLYNTDNFGDYAHFVIPFDKAKFGVAPSLDLWTSYNTETKLTLSFNNGFSEEFFNISAPDNYEKFSKYMNNEFMEKDFFDNKISNGTLSKLRDMMKDYDFPNTMGFLNKLLAPENFNSEYLEGFKVLDYKKMIGTKNGKQPVECWSDSNCLVVAIGRYDDVRTDIMSDKFEELLSIIE